MPDTFTNLDAMWLQQLADRTAQGDSSVVLANGVEARLRLIAQHLQSMDERLAVLQGNQSFAQGYAASEARMLARSNIVANPEGEDDTGRSILEQINRRVAEGNLKRVPLGERALDDKPDKFNAPFASRTGFKKQREAAKPVPAIDLDLSFLGEL